MEKKDQKKWILISNIALIVSLTLMTTILIADLMFGLIT